MNQQNIEQLYQRFQTPENVIAHMAKVAEVAAVIADLFLENKHQIDRQLVVHAALLHDTRRVEGADTHADLMADTLLEMDEDLLARIIRNHGVYEMHQLDTWESKIVFYSDKRVKGTTIVTLEERFLPWMDQDPRMPEFLNQTRQLEKQIIEITGPLPF